MSNWAVNELRGFYFDFILVSPAVRDRRNYLSLIIIPDPGYGYAQQGRDVKGNRGEKSGEEHKRWMVDGEPESKDGKTSNSEGYTAKL
ncbi:hypothetical protein KQX54_021066 [Cotesia glomerata]|uniref:Uncharacterized protein n=1 Tax=Cotesia glomerata TaxID=32391 RepID=A0AAV7I568_COTGL|nr:hypothetical protein KQX54_021066 [Cotesia glomerata]